MPQDISEIERNIRHYEEVIAGFERTVARLRARRKVAADGTAAHIDGLLALNEQTLESLKHVLGSAMSQLADAQPAQRAESKRQRNRS